MKEVTMCCTTCPSGCALKVMIDNNEVVSVEGNNCPRGEKFAHKEWINPERMLTSTVYAVINGKELLIPVKSKEPIPRKIMTEAMKEIQEISLNLDKKSLISKEKPRFRRSAVWQAAPFKITMISPVFSRVSAIFGNPFPSWRGVLLDGYCATQKDIA